MADDVISSLKAIISADISGLTSGLEKSQSMLGATADSMKSLGSTLTLGVTAPIAAFFATSVKAASDSEKVFTQLQAVLKSTGGAAGVTSDAAVKLSESLAKVTPFEDEAVLGAENMLLTFTNIGKNVFPQATETALDMSQALGQDLKSSSIQLGKALNDPIKGITALTRVGVTFTQAQKDQIEALVNAGDVMGAQKIILQELQKEFGGSAKAAGKTFAGQLDILTHKFGDFQEKIGGAIIPLLEKGMDIIGGFVDSLNAMGPETIQLVVGALAAAAALGPLLAVLGNVLTVLGFIVSGPGLLIGGVIAAIATNFGGLRDKLQAIIVPFQRFFGALQAGVDPGRALHMLLGDLIPPNILEGIQRLAQGFEWFVGDIQSIGLGPAILKAFGINDQGEGSWVEGVLTGFGMARDAAHNAVTGIGNFLQGLGNIIFGTVLPALQQFANWFLSTALPAVVGFVTGTVIPALQRFFAWLGTAWQNIQPALNQLFTWFTQTALPAVVSFVQNTVLPGIQRFFTWLGGVWETVRPALQQVADWFLNTALPAVVGFIQNTVMPAVEIFVNYLKAFWDVVGPALAALARWFLNDALPKIVSFINDNVMPVLRTLGGFLSGLWNAVRPGLEPIFTWFRDVFTKISGFIDGVITKLGQLKEAAGAWSGISSNANTIGAGLSSGQWSIGDVINAAIKSVGSEIFKAGGGPVSANSPYIVGERGPELFIPRASGNIIPNGGGRGLSGVGGGFSGTLMLTLVADDFKQHILYDVADSIATPMSG